MGNDSDFGRYSFIQFVELQVFELGSYEGGGPVQSITLNRPALLGREIEYLEEVIAGRGFSGDGLFTHRCQSWLEQNSACKKALLTTSGTHALEMAALLCRVQPEDEVIMPSFTFTSTANAFVLRGARIVFVDIRPDTMNIDEKLIEEAISSKTRVLVPVHYGGIAADMDAIMALARKYELRVVEDAAQGIGASHHEKALGTIGDFGIYSFHESKNVHCGEGGALLINDESLIDEAEIIREKGTDRSRFFRGQVDKYTWQDCGSSYLLSELNAAFLLAQLESCNDIIKQRLARWDLYYSLLLPLDRAGMLELPTLAPGYCHNAHIFYIKTRDIEERSQLTAYLKQQGIMAAFHFLPLHSAPAGRRFGRFHGEDRYTTKESERILRLPLFFGISEQEVTRVAKTVAAFYKRSRSV